MKTNKISTKIKIIGAVLILLMLSVIGITIYLNHQNSKDALIINIAGKERMLTQKISKNIFYIQHNPHESLNELNLACDEFINGLNTLKYGNKDKEISAVVIPKVLKQIEQVDEMWNAFYRDVALFKNIIQTNPNDKELENIALSIYRQNNGLLENVDRLVSIYTAYSEDKTRFIKVFQYISAGVLLLLFTYSLIQLKSIESHVDSFMQYSKMLVEHENLADIEPIKLEAESEAEIVEVGDAINIFIQKINSAVEYSNEALQQSQNASSKLEELTEEFDIILDELQDKSLASKYLNHSEDIVIESTENLIISTKKLLNLKNELENLAKSCQIIKKDDIF